MNRVLLVEDNPGDAELTRLAFEEAGVVCELTVAETGEKALELLEARADVEDKYRPDLILLDLNLPGMDGNEVLRNVKSSEGLKRIPVIAISSSAAATDVLESYDLHVNSYIQKPLDMAGFVKIVEVIGEFWLTMTVLPPAPA